MKGLVPVTTQAVNAMAKQIAMKPLDTLRNFGHCPSTEPQNSFSNDGRQPVSFGFFCAHEKRKTTANYGREWANKIPVRGICPPFRLTVLNSRPFSLGNAEEIRKSNEVLYV